MHQIDLNGSWELTWCDPGRGERRGWPRGGPDGERIVEATVPGDVHQDLLEAGLIEEPLYGLNAADCEWMEKKDWWYSHTFHVAANHVTERVELCFDGLDCTADVWVNGAYVGSANNAYIPHTFEVAEAVRAGKNRVVVRVDDGQRAAEDKPHERYRLVDGPMNRAWIRKPQFVFSWDWAPRLVTCGIWRSVQLRSYRRAALRDVCLRTHLRDDDSARVEVLADVEVLSDEPLAAELQVTLGRNERHSTELSETLERGVQTLHGGLSVPEPDLWWPRPLGEPALYDVSVALRGDGEILDERHFRYGLREVELIQEPLEEEEGESFIIAVNGRKVYCKGANWVPPDSIIARVSPAKYRALVSAAAEANFNMLRIWGGGIFEDDSFYQLCDEHGILVWQDFLYACSYYPDDDPDFLAGARREAEAAVRRLRNHPCIALWCGNNENQWIHWQRVQAGEGAERCIGERIYEEVQPEVCDRLDPTRPYWPSSPYGGEDPASELRGNRHSWHVSILAPTLDERIDYGLYARDWGRFMTEFGVLAPPGLDSIRRYLPCGRQHRGSEAWEHHNNRFEKGTNQEALRRYWKPAEELSFEQYLRFSQMIQAEALKFALEHWRRRKFHTAGSLFWMYADCWGEVGWTVIDYYLNRKPAFWAVRRAFRHVQVSFARTERGVDLVLLNDTAEPVEGSLRAGWVNVRTGETCLEVEDVSAPPNASTRVGSMKAPEPEPEAWAAWAELERDGALVCTNRQFLAGFQFNHIGFPAAHVEIAQDDDDRGLELTADAYAWQVHIDAPRGVALEDNDFDLLPGGSREVGVEGPPELLERIHVEPLNAPENL